MNKVFIPVVTSLFTAVLVFFLMNTGRVKDRNEAHYKILATVEQAVQKSLIQSESTLQQQLAGLSAVIAANNDFSLKILVENDRSSRVITDMAANFLKPMNLSVLDITDSAYTILSSGQFPANAGNSCKKKAAIVTEIPQACTDNIMGSKILTLQAKKKFTIADFSFYIFGGFTIDTTFLSAITPNENTTLLLKNGGDYIGLNNIHSISEIKNHEIIINDKKYFASTIEIPSTGMNDSLTLFILIKK